MANDLSTPLTGRKRRNQNKAGRFHFPIARLLFVAIPQSFEAGQIIEQARAINPGLKIVARAHSDEEERHLKARGATLTIMGEREIARGMIEYARAG